MSVDITSSDSRKRAESESPSMIRGRTSASIRSSRRDSTATLPRGLRNNSQPTSAAARGSMM